MFFNPVYFLWTLLHLILAVESKEKVSVPMGRRIILESVQTNCDHDYVEYFHQVPKQETLTTFHVVKLVPSFTISISMRTVRSQRTMYKINKLEGCQFLKNQLMNKVLSQSYRALVVNNTFFKCPIQPKVYFLRNLTDAIMAPNIHPVGHYQLSVRIQVPQSSAPFVMELLWKFHIAYRKI